MVYSGFFVKACLRGYSPARLKLWGNVLVRVEEARWFGHGITEDPRTEILSGRILLHPHNVYVRILLYGDIIGLLFLIAVVLSALWQGFMRPRKPINLTSATMVLYGALCIGLNGNMHIHHAKPFWLFFWFPLAFVVASELPSHPLHGEFEVPKGGGKASSAAELRRVSQQSVNC